MSALVFFPKRIPEPKAMRVLDVGAFEKLAKVNYKNWFIPMIDFFLEQTALREGTVIDMACGPGFLSGELAIRRPLINVIGIDISSGALRLARKNTKGIPNVSFKKASVYDLPFQANSIDAIVCKDALHNFDNPRRAFKEMFRILKPEGHLYIQDMRRDLPTYLIQRSIGRRNSIEKLQYYSTRAAYTKDEIANTLRTLHIQPVVLSTPRLTANAAKRYTRQGIDFTLLKEGFQARYNLLICV